jgi:hypothetical protein
MDISQIEAVRRLFLKDFILIKNLGKAQNSITAVYIYIYMETKGAGLGPLAIRGAQFGNHWLIS